jgi:hypothetical protein
MSANPAPLPTAKKLFLLFFVIVLSTMLVSLVCIAAPFSTSLQPEILVGWRTVFLFSADGLVVLFTLILMLGLAEARKMKEIARTSLFLLIAALAALMTFVFLLLFVLNILLIYSSTLSTSIELLIGDAGLPFGAINQYCTSIGAIALFVGIVLLAASLTKRRKI